MSRFSFFHWNLVGVGIDTVDHAVLQSLDLVFGMTCHRPCVHHLVHSDIFKAHCKIILFCSTYGT